MPQRIQLSHRAGYRKPEGAIVVARPTKWGNPIKWQDYKGPRRTEDGEPWYPTDETCRRLAVVDFASTVLYAVAAFNYPTRDEIRRELAGHDLACWCPLDGPCHADVLLRIAAGGEP